MLRIVNLSFLLDLDEFGRLAQGEIKITDVSLEDPVPEGWSLVCGTMEKIRFDPFHKSAHDRMCIDAKRDQAFQAQRNPHFLIWFVGCHSACPFVLELGFPGAWKLFWGVEDAFHAPGKSSGRGCGRTVQSGLQEGGQGRCGGLIGFDVSFKWR